MSLLDWRQPGDAADGGDEIGRALRLLARHRVVPSDEQSTNDLRGWVESHDDPHVALGKLVLQAGHGRALHCETSPLALERPTLRWVPAAPPRQAQSAEAAVSEPPPAPRVAAHGATLEVLGVAATPRPVTEPATLSPRMRRQARSASWVRNAGVIVLVFLLYQWWGTGFEQARAQARLRAGYEKGQAVGGGPSTSAPNAPPDGATVPSPRSGGRLLGSSAAPALLPGGALARLQIPAIHLDQFVVEGTSEADLKRGPGHYTGSSLPGRPGNAAIAGHRTTYGAPFNRLDQLVPGDTIITTTTQGQFLYVVSNKLTVSPTESSVVEDYGDNRLTLTTCTPEFSATHRLVVVATLRGPATATPAAKVQAPPPVLLTGKPKHTNVVLGADTYLTWSSLPFVLLGIAFLVGLALLYRPCRRRLPPVAAAALLSPLWLAGLLYLFEQLNRFLPPNV